jgi:hypothetical protein
VLKQQLLITVYRLPTLENKLSFSVPVCSKKQKFAVSFFPFAAYKRKLLVFH